MEIFKERFGIDNQTDHEYANTKGWIVAIATAGAVFGCLGCVWLTQRLGRTRTFQFFTVVYMAGIFGQTFSNGNLGVLYATRVISGVGIGATTVLPSVYIAEVGYFFKSLQEFVLTDRSDLSSTYSWSPHSPIHLLPTTRRRLRLLLQLRRDKIPRRHKPAMATPHSPPTHPRPNLGRRHLLHPRDPPFPAQPEQEHRSSRSTIPLQRSSRGPSLRSI